MFTAILSIFTLLIIIAASIVIRAKTQSWPWEAEPVDMVPDYPGGLIFSMTLGTMLLILILLSGLADAG